MICFLRRARRCFAVKGAGAGVLTAWCIGGAVLRVKASELVACSTLANEIPFITILRCAGERPWIQLIAPRMSSVLSPNATGRFRAGTEFGESPIPRALRLIVRNRL